MQSHSWPAKPNWQNEAAHGDSEMPKVINPNAITTVHACAACGHIVECFDNKEYMYAPRPSSLEIQPARDFQAHSYRADDRVSQPDKYMEFIISLV